MSENEEIFLERCNLYAYYGFTVVSMAANNHIGKLCVLRRSDYPRSLRKVIINEIGDELDSSANGQSDEKDVENSFFLVEFYNIVSLPTFFLEKAVPIWDPPLESVVWLGNHVFLTGTDGTVLVYSPFSHSTTQFQLSASSIITSAVLSKDRLAFGTDSSEILIAHYADAEMDESTSDGVTTTSLKVVQRLKLSGNAQVICMATSKRRANLLAVGAVNEFAIFDLNKSNQPLVISVPHTRGKTVIWSIVFVDDFLFTGDSLGSVTIYNANTGAYLKAIDAHKSAILAMATNGVSVFTSGVDQRIQVISGIQSKKYRYDWVSIGQRLIHSNDVSALACVGEHWLVSGGSEHDIFISDRNLCIAFPIRRPTCFSGRHDEANLILMKYPHFVELWYRPNFSQFLRNRLSSTDLVQASLENGSKFENVHRKNDLDKRSDTIYIGAEQAEEGPKKLLQIKVSENSFISQAAISPNSTFFAFYTDIGLKVFHLNLENLLAKQDASLKTKRSKLKNTSEVLVKYWDSTELNESDRTDQMDVGEAFGYNELHQSFISALLITDEELFFAESDFTIWTLSLNAKCRTAEPKTLTQQKGAGHILRFCINPTKSMLLAITTNAQVLSIRTAQNDTTVDENNEKDENAIEVITFNYTAFDCTFVAENVALLACAQQDAQLVFVDVSSNTTLKILTRKDLCIGYHQFLTAMSDVRDDRIFVVTNKGKVRALSCLEKAQPIMHLKTKADEATINLRREGKQREKLSDFCRYEPFWGFLVLRHDPTSSTHETTLRKSKSTTPKKSKKVTAAVSEVGDSLSTNPRSAPKRTLLMVGHVARAPPTQIPMRRRGFETN